MMQPGKISSAVLFVVELLKLQNMTTFKRVDNDHDTAHSTYVLNVATISYRVSINPKNKQNQ